MRFFKLVNHLTVPRSLLPGPGNTHHRPEPGDVIAIPDEACARESRFVNGRVRAGDMVEVKEAEYLAHVKRCAELQAAQNTSPAPAATEPAATAVKGK